MTKKKRGPGRPKLAASERRRDVKVGLTPAERVELEAYAAREEEPLTTTIREAALRAARYRP